MEPTRDPGIDKFITLMRNLTKYQLSQLSLLIEDPAHQSTIY